MRLQREPEATIFQAEHMREPFTLANLRRVLIALLIAPFATSIVMLIDNYFRFNEPMFVYVYFVAIACMSMISVPFGLLLLILSRFGLLPRTYLYVSLIGSSVVAILIPVTIEAIFLSPRHL